MADSLEEYSKPAGREETKLATVYTLNYRDSKKGRLWIPIFDARFPLEFEVKFTYISKFLEQNNVSGNHYHKVKQEILVPLEGRFDVYLEDVDTHETEIIPLDSEGQKAVYIRTGISHKVVSKDVTGIMLVLASAPSTLEDEIEYKI